MAKLVRKTPSLKSQGAKYSVTNRKGETSYYASSKDVDAGKAPISKVGGSSKSDQLMGQSQTLLDQAKAMSGSIPANMGNPAPVNIPTPPVPNVGDVVGPGNTGLASVLGGMASYDGSKFTPTPTAPTDNFQSLFEQAVSFDKKAFDEMGTSEDRMRKLEKESQLRQKEQAVNDLTANLNQIVAERDANILQVEGQGRGIPEVIIGGQQAQINKEAAIKALPVQAQLAAAQGALELAQNHVDKMFQIQSQDALAQYQYKSKLIDSVYSFATAQEQRRLDAVKAKEDRAYDMQKTNIAMQNDWAKTALEYGQSNLVGQIMKLDPNSATFATDLATLQGKVQKPVTTTSADVPKPQNFGTSDKPMWGIYDPTTNSIIPVAGGMTEPQVQNEMSKAQDIETIDALSSIATNRGLSKAVGTNSFARWTPFKADTMTGDVQNFIATVDQTTKDLTLEKLIQAKAEGATFGALTAEELKLLSDSASKINSWRRIDEDKNTTHYEISEKKFLEEVDKINNFRKLDALLKGTDPAQIGVQIMDDGTYWTRNSDGTLTQLK